MVSASGTFVLLRCNGSSWSSNLVGGKNDDEEDVGGGGVDGDVGEA